MFNNPNLHPDFDKKKPRMNSIVIENILNEFYIIKINSITDLDKKYSTRHIKSITNIIKNKDYIKYIGNFHHKIQPSFSNSGVTIGIGNEMGVITAETLPQFIYPIVLYIHEFQPDCIVASDRGARFIGLAVKLLYQRLYGKLPTFDSTLRFRKVSRKASYEHNSNILSGIVRETLQFGKNGRILFLDDWIASGGTQSMVSKMVEEISHGQIDLRYGVLVGGGGDISGTGNTSTYGVGRGVDWHDNSQKIGVDYDSELHPFVVGGSESREYRERLLSGIEDFMKILKDKPIEL